MNAIVCLFLHSTVGIIGPLVIKLWTLLAREGVGKREKEAARNAEDVIARAAAADMSRGQTESRAAKHRLLLLLVEKKADGLTDCEC